MIVRQMPGHMLFVYKQWMPASGVTVIILSSKLLVHESINLSIFLLINDYFTENWYNLTSLGKYLKLMLCF